MASKFGRIWHTVFIIKYIIILLKITDNTEIVKFPLDVFHLPVRVCQKQSACWANKEKEAQVTRLLLVKIGTTALIV